MGRRSELRMAVDHFIKVSEFLLEGSRHQINMLEWERRQSLALASKWAFAHLGSIQFIIAVAGFSVALVIAHYYGF